MAVVKVYAKVNRPLVVIGTLFVVLGKWIAGLGVSVKAVPFKP